MFCDIAGFTAWSSVREPSQVFILLESVYAAFDEIASRRKVFKVETSEYKMLYQAVVKDYMKSHTLLLPSPLQLVIGRSLLCYSSHMSPLPPSSSSDMFSHCYLWHIASQRSYLAVRVHSVPVGSWIGYTILHSAPLLPVVIRFAVFQVRERWLKCRLSWPNPLSHFSPSFLQHPEEIMPRLWLSLPMTV